MLTPRQVFPWKTVTREEYYEAWTAEFERADGPSRADPAAAKPKTPYEEWLDGAAQRRKEREDLLRSLAASQPAAEVAKMRKTLEDTEREVSERLKASQSDQQASAAAAASAPDRPTLLRAKLASMSAAERRMPALLVADATEGGLVATGWRMVDRDGPGVRRALTPDYEHWRARRSPVEARAIQVYITTSCAGSRPPLPRVLWEAFTTLDWAALSALLETPR